MNRKIIIGILLGVVAGILDVIPMVLQELTWDANISAFSMWVVVGFLISISELRIPAVLKGILTSLLVLLPCAIIIGSKEPMSLVPIGIMTLVLGGILGISIEKFGKKT